MAVVVLLTGFAVRRVLRRRIVFGRASPLLCSG